MGTPDRSGSGEAQVLCGKVSREQAVRLISDNCEGQSVLFSLDRKKVPALDWLRDRVMYRITGACMATQLMYKTGSDSKISRDVLKHEKF